MANNYKYDERLSFPIIRTMRDKYNTMVLLEDVDDILSKFQLSRRFVEELLYSGTKHARHGIDVAQMIKLSALFEVDVEELVKYNATLEYEKINGKNKANKENEMLKQYDVGKKWEEQILSYYNKKGYFTYKIPTLNSGTVFDVIVVKNGAALMIECKHIEGDKLYYSGSGLLKKTDELDHFISTTGNNVYIYVKSDKTGTFWTTWIKAKPILQEKGYLKKEDCFPCEIDK